MAIGSIQKAAPVARRQARKACVARGEGATCRVWSLVWAQRFAIKEPAGCVAGELCRGSSRQWHGMFVSKRGTLSFERNHLNKRHSTLRLLVSRVYARNGPPRRRLSASDRRACFKRLGRNSPQRHVSPSGAKCDSGIEQGRRAGGSGACVPRRPQALSNTIGRGRNASFLRPATSPNGHLARPPPSR